MFLKPRLKQSLPDDEFSEKMKKELTSFPACGKLNSSTQMHRSGNEKLERLIQESCRQVQGSTDTRDNCPVRSELKGYPSRGRREVPV